MFPFTSGLLCAMYHFMKILFRKECVTNDIHLFQCRKLVTVFIPELFYKRIVGAFENGFNGGFFSEDAFAQLQTVLRPLLSQFTFLILVQPVQPAPGIIIFLTGINIFVQV